MSISLPRSRKMQRSRRKNFRVASPLLVASLLLLFSPAKAEEVCVSKGGRFPPYSSEGRPPRKVSKGPKDLTLCRVFRRKTCCDVAQTHAALVTVRKLALTGDATDECVQLWELLECSICDPRVGVQPGPPRICASFCDRVFQACSSAYFSTDAITQVLAPCGTTEIICARATEWVSNGTDLCQAAGFAVKVPLYPGEEETSCYGSKASLDSIADSWNSNSDVPEKLEKEAVLGDFMQQMKEMPLRKKVFWAVGGMVLTAGLLVISKRKGHSQRKRLVAIQQAARKMDSQKSGSSAKWKGKGRRLTD
ncbi:uncharacterized protein LOC116214727 [Punica granatum]|uniref:Uncharacterized protein LOC116214727 n=1 Tax=Punica granatum TaxID=22663 RepID=A0A6P8EL82_PUNGR|nr:uncharacterized protein LOC116214727 [Punica granatum]